MSPWHIGLRRDAAAFYWTPPEGAIAYYPCDDASGGLTELLIGDDAKLTQGTPQTYEQTSLRGDSLGYSVDGLFYENSGGSPVNVIPAPAGGDITVTALVRRTGTGSTYPRTCRVWIREEANAANFCGFKFASNNTYSYNQAVMLWGAETSNSAGLLSSGVDYLVFARLDESAITADMGFVTSAGSLTQGPSRTDTPRSAPTYLSVSIQHSPETGYFLIDDVIVWDSRLSNSELSTLAQELL